MTNIPYVKGIDLPTLNPCQRSMIELFADEHDNVTEPERIDKVEVINDYTIRVYTSRFIELTGIRRSSSDLSRHLQIMSTYRMYDDDPQPDLTLSDPYCDYEQDRAYREVLMSSVYRTLEGDEGWIVNIDPKTFRDDESPLYVWEGTL